MRALWICFAVACSMPPDPPATPGPEPLGGPVPHEATEHPEPLPSLPALDPSTVCGRAQRCCQAFAAITPNVAADIACAEPADAATAEDADARCGRMIIGWRAALEAHEGAEIPDECAVPERRRRRR
ncbi:MAG: hypothetical protein R3B82_28140 [Sandaracinaceae bacterium]